MAHEERSQDQLAQFELLVRDRMDVFHRNPQNPAGCADDACQIHTLTGEQTDLTDEFARSISHEHEFVRLSF